MKRSSTTCLILPACCMAGIICSVLLEMGRDPDTGRRFHLFSLTQEPFHQMQDDRLLKPPAQLFATPSPGDCLAFLCGWLWTNICQSTAGPFASLVFPFQPSHNFALVAHPASRVPCRPIFKYRANHNQGKIAYITTNVCLRAAPLLPKWLESSFW